MIKVKGYLEVYTENASKKFASASRKWVNKCLETTKFGDREEQALVRDHLVAAEDDGARRIRGCVERRYRRTAEDVKNKIALWERGFLANWAGRGVCSEQMLVLYDLQWATESKRDIEDRGRAGPGCEAQIAREMWDRGVRWHWIRLAARTSATTTPPTATLSMPTFRRKRFICP